jgi:hypothetical protein
MQRALRFIKSLENIEESIGLILVEVPNIGYCRLNTALFLEIDIHGVGEMPQSVLDLVLGQRFNGRDCDALDLDYRTILTTLE